MILEVRARLAIVFSRNCHHQTNTCNQYCSVMTQWCTTQAANWPRRNPTPPLSGYWRDWQRPDFRGAALEHLVEPASWPMDGRPVKAACVRSCAPCCHLFKLSCYLSFGLVWGGCWGKNVLALAPRLMLRQTTAHLMLRQEIFPSVLACAYLLALELEHPLHAAV